MRFELIRAYQLMLIDRSIDPFFFLPQIDDDMTHTLLDTATSDKTIKKNISREWKTLRVYKTREIFDNSDWCLFA